MDADGIQDLMTGCFEGHIYLVRGLGGGKFASPEAMLDSDEKKILIGQYWSNEEKKWTTASGTKYQSKLAISAHAVDFDRDGDLDLLMGSNDGSFFVRENKGSKQKNIFGSETYQIMVGATLREAESIKARFGKKANSKLTPLKVDKHAMPVTADWDGDGRFDILSGAKDGSVWWARNVGSKQEPRFQQAQELIPRKMTNEEGLAVGSGAQISVYDYNQDGKLDIIVGDRNSGMRKKLSDQEEKKLAEIRSRYKSTLVEKLNLQKKQKQLSASKKEKDVKEAKELIIQIKQLSSSLAKINKETEAIQPRPKLHGFVWLFEQK